MKYAIEYIEVLKQREHGYVYVEANSEEEAKDMVRNCEYDEIAPQDVEVLESDGINILNIYEDNNN